MGNRYNMPYKYQYSKGLPYKIKMTNLIKIKWSIDKIK